MLSRSYLHENFIPVDNTILITLGEYNPYESNEQDSREIAPTHEGLSAISPLSPKKEGNGIKQSSLFHTLAKSLEEAYKNKYAEEK